MKKSLTLLTGVSGLVLAWSLWPPSASSAAAATDGLPAVATVAVTVPALQDAEFVGSTKCKKCHLSQHKSWESKKHAKAMETLKPGNAAEAKAKHKLDPAKDYTKDATCVACHSVGFGKPGGYSIPADEEAAKKVKALEGVGCESCHGAGGKYLDLHEEIMKSKRKYKEAEMTAAGAVKPGVEVCLTCHNEKSPTVDPAVKFDFEAKKKDGVHDSVPLKQKE